jgi:chromate transport protein ChrA
MPTPVRVAVILLAVLAVLFLASGALSFFGRAAIADAFLRDNPALSRDRVLDQVVFGALRDVVIGLLAALSALRLPARQVWARWTGIAAGLLVALLALLSGFQAGGVSLFSLLALVLSIAIVTSLFTRVATQWLPNRRRPRES